MSTSKFATLIVPHLKGNFNQNHMNFVKIVIFSKNKKEPGEIVSGPFLSYFVTQLPVAEQVR